MSYENRSNADMMPTPMRVDANLEHSPAAVSEGVDPPAGGAPLTQ